MKQDPIKLECWEQIVVGPDGVKYKHIYCRKRDYITVNLPDNVG